MIVGSIASGCIATLGAAGMRDVRRRAQPALVLEARARAAAGRAAAEIQAAR